MTKTAKLEMVNVSKLKFFEGNPKKFTSKQYKRLLDSIKEIGITQPFLVNKRTMNVVDGNQRLKAAMQLDIKEVQVQYIDIEEADEGKVLIHLNKTHAEHDDDGFKALLSKYPEDVFLKAIAQDYHEAIKKSSQTSSAEFEIVREVDESYEYVMFITKKAVDQLNVETFFNLGKMYDQHKQKLIGMGRVIDGEKLTRLIQFATSKGISNIGDLYEK